MSTNPYFPTVQLLGRSVKEWITEIASVVNLAMRGKLNAVLSNMTLTANAASTTITDNRIGYFSFLDLMPLTAHAAAELVSGNVYWSQPMKGSVVLNHSNNAQTDRTFNVLIIG